MHTGVVTCSEVISSLAAPVDWWSFGILMYELVFGYTPFRRQQARPDIREHLEAEAGVSGKARNQPGAAGAHNNSVPAAYSQRTGKYHNRASTPLNAVTYNLHGFAKQ